MSHEDCVCMALERSKDRNRLRCAYRTRRAKISFFCFLPISDNFFVDFTPRFGISAIILEKEPRFFVNWPWKSIFFWISSWKRYFACGEAKKYYLFCSNFAKRIFSTRESRLWRDSEGLSEQRIEAVYRSGKYNGKYIACRLFGTYCM